MIFSLEGIDGCGKTTMAAFLQNYLRGAHGINTTAVSELNGTEFGKEMLAMLCDAKDVYQQYEIIKQARGNHFQNIVKPILDNGGSVIYDRFIHSTLAYQGGHELSQQCIIAAHHAAELPFPNLTILLDIAPIDAIKRLKTRPENNSMDQKSADFYAKLINGYNTAVESIGARTTHKRIDAKQSYAEVTYRIAAKVDEFFKDREGKTL